MSDEYRQISVKIRKVDHDRIVELGFNVTEVVRAALAEHLVKLSYDDHEQRLRKLEAR